MLLYSVSTTGFSLARITKLNTSQPEFILLFAGGYRKNFGPGGAGSVLINIGGSLSPHEIVSMSSVSYRSSVSSPVAEYHGLLNGLRYI